MFDSEPRGREGEPVEAIVPEAISATASGGRKGGAPQRPRAGGETPPWRGPAFAGLVALGVLEALALVAILALWGSC